MNVNPNRPRPEPGENHPVAPSSPRSRTSGPERPGVAPGQVELSPRAQEFVRLRSQLEDLPAVAREERIARLRTLVARGAYAVDGGRIADAMLRDEAVALTLFRAAR